jgi:hypothetical protein
MVKRKRINNGQEKKEKQFSLLAVVCPFSLDHCLSFFS